MNNMKLKYIVAALLTCLSGELILAEEDLSKEITLEKEIVPEQHEVSRLKITPRLNLSDVNKKELKFNERNVVSPVAPLLSRLEPVAFADKLPVSPYDNGYLQLGYFPGYNLGLSAGYNILDTDKTRLSSWLQFNGKYYKGDNVFGEEIGLRSNIGTLGLALDHKVNEKSLLGATIDYTFGRYNNPLYIGDCNQNVHRVNLGLEWTSKIGNYDYNVAIGYGHFGYGNDGASSIVKPMDEKAFAPVRENKFNLNGGVKIEFAENYFAGLDIDLTYFDYSQMSSIIADSLGTYVVSGSKYHKGGFSWRPYYKYVGEMANIKIGAVLDFAFNADNVLYFAPDVELNWMPSEYVALYACLKGGMDYNTLGALWDYSIYSSPMLGYGCSHIPVDLKVGMNLGKWKGLSLGIWGGYSLAKDWLMPVIAGDMNYYKSVDLKGFVFGASLGYEYREIVDVNMGIQIAPQDLDKGYYMWRDRAKLVLDAELSVRPVEALTMNIGYEYRADRMAINSGANLFELGNINNLSFGVDYRLTQQFSVFAQLENILNEKCYIAYNVPAQGFTGLVGVSYKF